ncbi:VWA domain-containing protein [Bizionia argentinensis JUB59]|uniref:VWA domain-containing protein n=1 Tax=Bizionia argentinensis JUB59 TaxID=1046627 RepID=G2EEG8_9FLAO|nr:VWA domain-containing protein [Bizionia argentinensis]EGV43131.1 VWA domain-containing protein [Bizionia argentinensis JUB59]
MGGGRFSHEAYSRLRKSKGYSNKSREEIFTSINIDPEMDPANILLRESRDSQEHPETVSIIVGLDVTGSMGFVPEHIVKEALPDLIGSLMEAGIQHPQVLFIGIGDFIYDKAPLQIGQFESSAELLDRWLTRVYLESGGGGNNQEGYNLAHLFAARHTAIDCWEKRKQKGFLFTIGDEPVFPTIPAEIIKRYTCVDEAETITTEAIFKEAQEKYHVFHMHLEHNEWAKQPERKGNWKTLLGENFIEIPDYKKVAKQIAEIVIQHHKPTLEINSSEVKDTEGAIEQHIPTSETNTSDNSDTEVENML